MKIKYLLIDINGVLYTGKGVVEGAVEAIGNLRNKKIAFRFISNATRKPRASVLNTLLKMGFNVSENEIFTPAIAAVEHIKKYSPNQRKIFLLAKDELASDFNKSQIEVVKMDEIKNKDVNFVVVGDAGEEFTFNKLNTAFNLLIAGAELIALEKDRFWETENGLTIDAGFFVAGLEYVTGKKAHIVGKPNTEFFNKALQNMGANPSETAVIGDDIFSDIGGAKNAGLMSILVRTGKYRKELVERSGVKPDYVIDSIADINEII